MSKKRNKSLDLRSWNHRMFYTLVSKMTKTMNNQSSFTTKFLSINKSTMFAALACTLLSMQRLHLIIHHLKCPYIWECFLFPLPCSSSRNMRKPWSTSELFSGTSRATSRLWTWRNSSTRPWRKVTINLESQHNSSIASVIVNYMNIYILLTLACCCLDGLVGMAIVGGIGLGVAGLAGLIGLAVSKGAAKS